MFVTITKAAAADINDIAVASFFPDQAPLAVVPGDPDANPANFRGPRQEAWEPAPVPIFVGARVQLTKNIHKEMDYVNGMGATILGLQQGGVRVRTDTGFNGFCSGIVTEFRCRPCLCGSCPCCWAVGYQGWQVARFWRATVPCR